MNYDRTNYNQSQEVTLTSLEDSNTFANTTHNFSMDLSPSYNQTVEVTVLDNDSPSVGIEVVPDTAVTLEPGDWHVIGIALRTAITGDVTLTISTDATATSDGLEFYSLTDDTNQINTVTFTVANGDQPQHIFVVNAGDSDTSLEASTNPAIYFSEISGSSDPSYNGLSGQTSAFTVDDDD